MLSRLHERSQQLSSSAPPIHFYSSSGGNAGLAAATAAATLSLPCTVVVPLSTPALMINKIRGAGATDVIQTGVSWQEADDYLRDQLLGKDQSGIYVPPFDHEDIWEGVKSALVEIAAEWGTARKPPKALVCSVGGGGLLCGVARGLDAVGWGYAEYQPSSGIDALHSTVKTPTTIIAVETRGCHSLALSLEHNSHIALDEITSAAKTLGAKKVAKRAYDIGKQDRTKNVVLSDQQAARGCIVLADEERILAELSCGVSYAVCLDRKILEASIGEKVEPDDEVIVMICGGSNINTDLMAEMKRSYAGQAED